MVRAILHIDDIPNRLTVKAMLERAGHQVVDESGNILITDSLPLAKRYAQALPTLLLTPASTIADAVCAMRDGVADYAFLPLQPNEVPLKVARLTHNGHALPLYQDQQETVTLPTNLTLDEVELKYIQEVLRRCKHNQARAARLLGIGRNTLWRKLKRIQPQATSQE